MMLWCTIQVEDLDRSVVFYEQVVGLELKRRFFSTPEKEIAFLADGETQVELIMQPGSTYPVSDQISLGFKVDRVHEKLKELRAQGVPIYKDVMQPNERVRFFYVKDPDGVSIQFVEMIKG